MKISERMLQSINDQINMELESAYIYAAMEAWFLERNLDGFAHYFHIQQQEEQDHARIFFDYLARIGSKVKFQDIKAYTESFSSEIDVLEKTLAHEQAVTRSIHEMMDLAREEKDYSAQALLMWFVKEQDEEEENATTYLEKLKLINGSPSGIFMLDAQLKNRPYHPIRLADIQ